MKGMIPERSSYCNQSDVVRSHRWKCDENCEMSFKKSKIDGILNKCKYYVEVYLEPCQTSTIELFCENW